LSLEDFKVLEVLLVVKKPFNFVREALVLYKILELPQLSVNLKGFHPVVGPFAFWSFLCHFYFATPPAIFTPNFLVGG
jgi:hypothetical protein